MNAIAVVAFDEAQARGAAAAFDQCGKGIDPRARLHLGGFAASALAKSLECPALGKGEEFGHADVRAA